MRAVTAAFVAAMMSAGMAATAGAQAPATPGAPPPQIVPPAGGIQQPDPVTGQPATPVAPGQPTAAAPLLTRSFTAPSGLLFNTVRPERVKDFETVIWYLQQALQKSTDPTVRAQAKGWRVFKATEPGPNGSVLYVFWLDPAVPGADYGLGRILADAYPEQMQEIWKLYRDSVTGGGSLLNLTPVEPAPPAPAAAAPAEPATPGLAPRTPPPPPAGQAPPPTPAP